MTNKEQFIDLNVNDHEFKKSIEVALTTVIDHKHETSSPDFAVHRQIKHGQIEELYQLIINLGDHKKDEILRRSAARLDNDGLAALHHCALRTSVAVVRLLLDNGVFIDTESEDGETPLHVALRHRNQAVADTLVDRGASLTKTDSCGNNALLLAIESCQSETAIKILKRNPLSVRHQNDTGFTALHYGAMLGDTQLCGALLKNGAKITAKNINGETPLHLASLLDNVNVLEFLLKKSASCQEDMSKLLSIERNDKLTALQIAAKMGHLESVSFILDIGIKIDLFSGSAATALELAAGNGHVELIKLLLSKGAAVNAQDCYRNAPLHVAAMKGHSKAVRVLLSNGAEVDIANEDRWTPLFFAVSRRHLDVARILLENGADSNWKDSKLCCCLHYAVRENDCKLIHLLLQYADNGMLFQRNMENRLCLHDAVLTGNELILEMLLERCSGTIVYCDGNKTLIHLAAQEGKAFCLQKLIDVWPREYLDMQDSNKETALHLAAMNGHHDICRLLIESKADVHLRNSNGRKAVHLAMMMGHNLVLKEFIEANVKMLPDESYYLVLADNVEGFLMFMDYSVARLAGKVENRWNRFTEVLDYGHVDIVEAIVEHESFSHNVKSNNLLIDELMEALIPKYPEVALKVLDQGVSFSNHRIDSPDFEITYDFAALETSPEMAQTFIGSDVYFGPGLMAKSDRFECLAHPLTQKMMALKWNQHGAWIFYSSLIFYLTFVILLTTLVVLERNIDFDEAVKAVKLSLQFSQNGTNKTQRTCLNCQPVHIPSKRNFGKSIGGAVFGFACLQLVKEVFQMIVLRGRYLKDATNIIEWVTYVSAIGFTRGFLFSNPTGLNTELGFGVCSIFFAWLNVMLFLRRSPLFNIYVVMFTQVILTLVRVLFAFTPLLFAFALAFNQLFIAQPLFKDFGKSLMNTFVMFSGELDYSDTLPNSIGDRDAQSSIALVSLPAVAYLLFIFLIVMVTVALMNLLVGLAVGDIESIRKNAKYSVLKQQAQYIEDLNSKCPTFILKWAYTRFHTEKPNRKTRLQRIVSFSAAMEDECLAYLHKRFNNRSALNERKNGDGMQYMRKAIEEQGQMMRGLATKMETISRSLRDLKSPESNIN